MSDPSDGQDISRKDSRLRPLRDAVKAFDKLAIGLPERIRHLALLVDDEQTLSPGPCSTEHTLQAALASIQSVSVSSPTLTDPAFGDELQPGDS